MHVELYRDEVYDLIQHLTAELERLPSSVDPSPEAMRRYE
jgi:hypothetical protein